MIGPSTTDVYQMILTKEQAFAVFSAIYTLNSVGTSHIALSIGDIEIAHIGIEVVITKRDRPHGLKIIATENYSTPFKFASAYGFR